MKRFVSCYHIMTAGLGTCRLHFGLSRQVFFIKNKVAKKNGTSDNYSKYLDMLLVNCDWSFCRVQYLHSANSLKISEMHK